MKVLQQSSPVKQIVGLLLLVAIFFFVKYVHQYQLGGYDLSPLVDLTYRLSRGEVPGVDFINTFPLSFLWWLKLNQFFFKDNWNFLFYCNITHLLICIFFVYHLLKDNERIKELPKFSIYLMLFVPLMVTNHIWHSSFSQYNFIVIFISVSNIILRGKIKPIDFVVFLLFTGFLLFSKQNIGILGVGLFAVTLITCWYKKIISFNQLLLAALVFVVSTIFYIFSIHFLLHVDYMTFIRTYTSVARRGIPSREQLRDVYLNNKENTLLLIVLCAFSLKILFELVKSSKTDEKIKFLTWFNLGVQIIGYYSFFTNWDVKLNDFILIAVSDIFLLELLPVKNFKFKVFYPSVILLFGISIFLAIVRYRMRKVGIANNYYSAGTLYRINTGYLEGLHVSERLITIINKIDSLQANGNLSKRVFFGPRMEFGYAQYQLQSPPHMPLWWHPGSSYSLKDEDMVVQTFERSNFDVLIFLNEDRTRMPPAIVSFIEKNYSPVPNNATLDIYKKK